MNTDLLFANSQVSGVDGSAEAEILSFKSAVLVLFKQEIIQRHIADVDFDGQTIANVAVCCSFGCDGTSHQIASFEERGREGTKEGGKKKMEDF